MLPDNTSPAKATTLFTEPDLSNDISNAKWKRAFPANYFRVTSPTAPLSLWPTRMGSWTFRSVPLKINLHALL